MLNRNVCHVVVLVVLALVLWSGGEPCSAKITRGPVLLRLEQTRAAVMWETDTSGAGGVRYGAGEELTDQTPSEPVRVSFRHATATKNVYIHKVWLDDLKAHLDELRQKASQAFDEQAAKEAADAGNKQLLTVRNDLEQTKAFEESLNTEIGKIDVATVTVGIVVGSGKPNWKPVTG